MPSPEAEVQLQTCLGTVALAWRGRSLASVRLGPFNRGPNGGPGKVTGAAPDAAGEALVQAVQAYFRGEPVRLSCSLDLSEATDFQRAVWETTEGIPHGETRSYSWVAEQIGRPHSARAVGAALGRNPVPIVVPCHRVLGASGALTGFGYGLEWKRGLLDLERPTPWSVRGPA